MPQDAVLVVRRGVYQVLLVSHAPRHLIALDVMFPINVLSA